MTGQTSDFGSIDYVADPNSPSGYRAVQSLSPEQKELLTQSQGIQRQLNAGLGGIAGQPFDLNAARGREISDMQRTFLDPQFDRQREQLESRLLNQGIRPGSAAYRDAMDAYSGERDNAYNRMYLDAYRLGNETALTERNLPLEDYRALIGAMSAGPRGLTPASTPSPGVSTTPVGQYVYDSFNQQQQQANSRMQGLFGLAGSLGSAYAGSQAGSAAITALLGLSDRKAKMDIKPVGRLDNGLIVYSFRYRVGGPVQIGLMADEVKDIHPEAVIKIGQYDHVDYSKAVL